MSTIICPQCAGVGHVVRHLPAPPQSVPELVLVRCLLCHGLGTVSAAACDGYLVRLRVQRRRAAEASFVPPPALVPVSGWVLAAEVGTLIAASAWAVAICTYAAAFLA